MKVKKIIHIQKKKMICKKILNLVKIKKGKRTLEKLIKILMMIIINKLKSKIMITLLKKNKMKNKMK